MKARLDYVWRLFATAIVWLWFAVLCLAMNFVVLPVARFGRPATAAQLHAQAILHRAARRYVRFAQRLGVFDFDAQGAERLVEDGPHLVVANHPGLLDVVYLLALMPQADCIISASRADNFFLGGIARGAGYLRNDLGHDIVRECVQRLRAGRSVIVFPEGTRSPASGLGTFHRGAARIALEAGCDLLPVFLRYDPPALGKGRHWFDLPERRFHASVRVGRALRSAPVLEALHSGRVTRSVAARHLTSQLREIIAKELDLVVA